MIAFKEMKDADGRQNRIRTVYSEGRSAQILIGADFELLPEDEEKIRQVLDAAQGYLCELVTKGGKTT